MSDSSRRRFFDGAQAEVSAVPLEATSVDVTVTPSVLVLASSVQAPSVSNGTFSPSTYGNTVYWLDAQVAASLKKTGGSTAGDTENIETWEDQSATGIDATQTTSGAQPVLDADGINGHPGVQGASGDFFTIDAPALFRNKSGVTCAFVLKYSDSGAAQGILQQWTANGTFADRINNYINASDRVDMKSSHPDGTTGELYSNDALTDATVYVVFTRYDFAGNEGSLWYDGTEVHTEVSFGGTASTSNTQAADGTRFVALMATDKDGSNTFRGLLGEVIVWDEALTDTEIQDATTALQAKWAPGGTDVTVTPSVLNLASSVQAPSVSTSSNVTITPSVLNLASSVQAPTVTAQQNVTVNPSTLNLASSVQAPTVTAQRNVTLTPSTLNLASSVQSPTVALVSNATVTPSVLNLASSVQAPTVSVGTNVTVTPSVLILASDLIADVTAVSDITVTPSTLVLASSVQAPSVSAGTNVTVTPSVLVLQSSLISEVSAISDVTVTPEVLVLDSNLPSGATVRIEIPVIDEGIGSDPGGFAGQDPFPPLKEAVFVDLTQIKPVEPEPIKIQKVKFKKLPTFEEIEESFKQNLLLAEEALLGLPPEPVPVEPLPPIYKAGPPSQLMDSYKPLPNLAPPDDDMDLINTIRSLRRMRKTP